MAAVRDIDVGLLRQLLTYDPDTGIMLWLPRERGLFNRSSSWSRWNRWYAGRVAMTAKARGGYLHGRIFGVAYRAHRVVWALHHGEWPHDMIDHINGIKTDNRIENLRVVSIFENQQNVSRRKTNKSGVTGVCWDSANGKWRAQLSVNKQRVNLGRFADFEEAVAVRKAAAIAHGFHPNHGRN